MHVVSAYKWHAKPSIMQNFNFGLYGWPVGIADFNYVGIWARLACFKPWKSNNIVIELEHWTVLTSLKAPNMEIDGIFGSSPLFLKTVCHAIYLFLFTCKPFGNIRNQFVCPISLRAIESPATNLFICLYFSQNTIAWSLLSQESWQNILIKWVILFCDFLSFFRSILGIKILRAA